MPFLKRAKEVTNDLAAITQRTRLELEARRVESKMNAHLAAIGRELYPRLKSGDVEFDSPRISDSVGAISSLEDELRDKQAKIGTLRRREKDRFADASIANIDDNATSSASARQTASDREAKRQGNPAEQGGSG